MGTRLRYYPDTSKCRPELMIIIGNVLWCLHCLAKVSCGTISAECAHSILPPTSSVRMAVHIRLVLGCQGRMRINGAIVQFVLLYKFLEGPLCAC